VNSSAERNRRRDRRPLDGRVPDLLSVPLAPEEGVEVPLAEPLDRLRQLALEGEPSHLAVGDDVQARFLLEPDRLVDGAVLNPLELWRSDLAAVQPVARLEQPSRPEEASDHVGARLDHAPTLCPLASIQARAHARVPL
jgi:hypothetical protein